MFLPRHPGSDWHRSYTNAVPYPEKREHYLKQNTARIEHDKALGRVMLQLLKDDTEVYKQFVQNESFRRFVTDFVFTLTNDRPVPPVAIPI